jgi:hypothetical protein
VLQGMAQIPGGSRQGDLIRPGPRVTGHGPGQRGSCGHDCHCALPGSYVGSGDWPAVTTGPLGLRWSQR